MSEVILDTITGKSTATTITIGSTPVVSASANSMTIRGEGSNQTSIQQGLAKSWCVFDGTGTIASADSFNFSSLTDNATGDYRVTMATDMGSINYVAVGSNIGATSSYYNSFMCTRGVNKNASSYRFTFRHEDGGANDMDVVNTAVHGDLA